MFRGRFLISSAIQSCFQKGLRLTIRNKDLYIGIKVFGCPVPSNTTKVVFFMVMLNSGVKHYRPKYLFTASTRLVTCSFS
jgi:hypothetical protein